MPRISQRIRVSPWSYFHCDLPNPFVCCVLPAAAHSTAAEVASFFRKVEPSGASVTSLKALHKALRPGQSIKHLLRKPEEAVRDADQPITGTDLVTDGLTEQEAAELRAEAHLKAGRLPSLSPDEDEDGAGGRPKKGAVGTEFVWHQMEARLAPDGVDAVPQWQREALHRAQWAIDVNHRASKRDQKQRHESLNPATPAWDRPVRPSKRRLLERELRQHHRGDSSMQNDSVPRRGAAVSLIPASASGLASPLSFGNASADGVKTATASNLVGANPARKVLKAVDPDDTSAAHMTWLKKASADHDATTTQRVNKIAFYEQALQQLQLQKQEIEHGLETAAVLKPCHLHVDVPCPPCPPCPSP